MNRTDLHQLAEDRLLDAEALINDTRWSAAYYLAGYAVECALKACIAKLTNLHDFPDKHFAAKCFTHNIEELLIQSGLGPQFNADTIANPALHANWQITKDWDEKARYQQWSELQARELFQAISDANNGVLPWIKGHW